ncbi:MAG: hydrogenase maturation protease [Candidatus Promineifilaceae bacterium]
MTEFLVIGIGSDLRGDDGVGLVVARQLQDQVPPGARVIEHYGDGTSLISAWEGVDHVILVDAVSSGAEPGTIYRFDAHSAPLPARISASSTHAFGLEEAMELARQLDQLPKSLVVYGIEGKSFSNGTVLSMEVDLAVEVVVEQILQEISNL